MKKKKTNKQTAGKNYFAEDFPAELLTKIISMVP